VKKTETFFAVAGVGLFAVVASRIGWGVAVDELKKVWIALPLVVGLGILRLLLQTHSWRLALQDAGVTIPFGELVGIRMASQSMGYLSVLGPAVSEPMKIKLLENDWKVSATATMVDSGVYWFSSTLIGIVGCVAAAIVLAGGHYSVTLLTITALFVICAALLLRQKSLLSSLVNLCGPRSPRWLKKAADLETQIRTFRERHPATLRSMMRMDLVCQCLLVAEAALIIFAAKLPVHTLTVLGIEAAVRVTKMTAGWIPARIGADEAGAVAAFAAFGFSPAAGLMLALARRSRDLLWCVLGLGWLAWRSHQTMKNRISAEVA
jgi:Lysylphosphatidylglycerol synthase TM region